MNRIHIYIIAWVALAGAGCSRVDDVRLLDVAGIVDDNPQAAMENLQRINYDSLSEPNRHYYDLLSIKAKDKSYIEHGSDSLILDVIDYSESHRTPYRAEALYYGGRVYSDLGDYPTSLDYFQKALDATDATDTTDTTNLHLRGNITSQMGRLLADLQMHSYAIPYLREALRIDYIERDTFCLAYDNQLIGYTYLRNNVLDSASFYIDRAVHYANFLPKEDSLNMEVMKAAIDFAKGDINKARLGIRNLPDAVDKMGQNLTFVYALRIYYAAGAYDTVYQIAERLRHFPRTENRKTAYRYLFKPEILNYLDKDSVLPYLTDYKATIEAYLSLYDQKATTMQVTQYNYSVHQRERIKAEKEKRAVLYYLIVAIAVILFIAVAYLILRYRNVRQKLVLHKAINQINVLQILLDNTSQVNTVTQTNNILKEDIAIQPDDLKCPAEVYIDEECRTENEHSIARLRSQVIDELLSAKSHNDISPKVLNSETLGKVRQMLEAKKIMNEENAIWEELESLIIENYPKFFKVLTILSDGKLTRSDRHILCLIKCNIKPTNISQLLGKSKGAVSSKRSALSLKLFNEKLGNKAFDEVVRKI